MKIFFAIVLQLTFSGLALAETPPGWECSKWADGSYYLYCGGAQIGQYSNAISCIEARKQICGPSYGDYECRKWPDNTYYLYCGTAYVGHYKTALECIAGKRAICD